MLLANFNFRVLVHHFELCWPSSCHLFLGTLCGGLWFNHFRSLACDWCLNSLDVVFHNLILSFRVLILITKLSILNNSAAINKSMQNSLYKVERSEDELLLPSFQFAKDNKQIDKELEEL
jgi:hypothetical protein